jgi:hypothetical protein
MNKASSSSVASRARWNADLQERKQPPLYEALAEAFDFSDPDLWRSNSLASLRPRLVIWMQSVVARLECDVDSAIRAPSGWRGRVSAAGQEGPSDSGARKGRGEARQGARNPLRMTSRKGSRKLRSNGDEGCRNGTRDPGRSTVDVPDAVRQRQELQRRGLVRLPSAHLPKGASTRDSEPLTKPGGFGALPILAQAATAPSCVFVSKSSVSCARAN